MFFARREQNVDCLGGGGGGLWELGKKKHRSSVTLDKGEQESQWKIFREKPLVTFHDITVIHAAEILIHIDGITTYSPIKRQNNVSLLSQWTGRTGKKMKRVKESAAQIRKCQKDGKEENAEVFFVVAASYLDLKSITQ